MNNRNYFPRKSFNSSINPKNICVLPLAIGSHNSFDITVVYRVVYILMFRMITADWSINSNRYNITYHITRLIKSSVIMIPKKINLVHKPKQNYQSTAIFWGTNLYPETTYLFQIHCSVSFFLQPSKESHRQYY